MRSSVNCLPQGNLIDLTLSQDRLVIQASVIYEREIAVNEGQLANWLQWKITQLSTVDGKRIYLASVHLPAMGGPLGRIETIGEAGSITAHQTKGLATAVGIWSALRREPMLHRAVYFRDQRASGATGRTLAEHLASEYHFGLNPRACHWAEQAGLN